MLSDFARKVCIIIIREYCYYNMTERHIAYTALLMRHHDMLWHMCLKRVRGDRDRCQDMLQEVFIALWENYGKLRPNASPKQERAWVCWQARSVFYQAERRKTLSTVPFDEFIAEGLTDEEAQHHKELVEELLSALTPEEQRMVRLYLEGYQGDEIGEKMGVSRDTVYQRMRRIVKKLRSVALIVLAMLLTALVAVAVVPQWRRAFFGLWKGEEAVADTVPAEICSAPALQDTIPLGDISRKKSRKLKVPLEKMPPLDIVDLIDHTDKHIENYADRFTSLLLQDIPTVSRDGASLIVTGADGELVRVYDFTGKLVFAQKAGALCIIDLFPGTSNWSCKNEYILQIGNLPDLKVKM